MSRSRNSLLGQGGQRQKMGKNAMRGKQGGTPAAQQSAAEAKQELLKKLREKNDQKKTED